MALTKTMINDKLGWSNYDKWQIGVALTTP